MDSNPYFFSDVKKRAALQALDECVNSLRLATAGEWHENMERGA